MLFRPFHPSHRYWLEVNEGGSYPYELRYLTWHFPNREHRKSRGTPEANEDAIEVEERQRQEKNGFLRLVIAKVTGESVTEMPPLEWDPTTSHRAVFLITTLIEFGNFELSKNTYNLLARHVGMSQNSISHWALCVIDRSMSPSYCYDLMSDQMALNLLGKNYFRVAEITSEFIETWSSCSYIGETTKTHAEIQELGKLSRRSPRQSGFLLNISTRSSTYGASPTLQFVDR